MSTSTRGSRLEVAGVVVSILALLVALGSLVFAFFQQRENVRLTELINLDPGELIVHAPTEFCIARGYSWFPSDHLIIPIVLENTGRGAKYFENPTLFFADSVTGESITFEMEGFISYLGDDIFSQESEIARAVVVPERSVTRNVLVFHIDAWWDEESPKFTYRFWQVDGGTNLVDVRLGYYEVASEIPIYWQDGDNEVFLTLPLYSAINSMGLNPEMVDYLAAAGWLDKLDNVQSSYYDADCFALHGGPAFPQAQP